MKKTILSIAFLALFSPKFLIAQTCKQFKYGSDPQPAVLDQCFMVAPAFWYAAFDKSKDMLYYINNEMQSIQGATKYSVAIVRQCYPEHVANLEKYRKQTYDTEMFISIAENTIQSFQREFSECFQIASSAIKNGEKFPSSDDYKKLDEDLWLEKITDEAYDKVFERYQCLETFDYWTACLATFNHYKPGRVGLN